MSTARGARDLLLLCWRLDRRRLLLGGGLVVAACLATPVAAVALGALTDAALDGRGSAALAWAVPAALALVAEVQLGQLAHLAYFRLGEAAEAEVSREVMHLVNGSPTLRPGDPATDADAAARLTLLLQDVARIREGISAMLHLAGLALQALVAATVLATVVPWLCLLPLAALVPVLAGQRADAVLQAGRERAAGAATLAAALRTIATSPSGQKEIRLAGAEEFLLARLQRAQAEADAELGRAGTRHTLLRGAGQAVLAAAYVAAVVTVVLRVRDGRAQPGDVVLLTVLVTAVAAQLAAVLQVSSTLAGVAAGLRRLADLREPMVIDLREAPLAPAEGPAPARPARRRNVPERLSRGIVLDHVGFLYPGSSVPALHDVTLRLPPGSSVALVGENGSGKSTLISLLTGLRLPTSGRLLIDGIDLADVDAPAWQARTATLFQDAAHLEFTVQDSVGVGEVADADDPDAVAAAFARARADGVLEQLPDGLATLLGRGYGEGRELSGGQWQSVGLARTLMRTEPLLLCLDEPAAALDTSAEDRMYDAYAHAARDFARSSGGVTLFVTHRLATVALADLVVVLERGQVVEVGTHAELLTLGGRYAQLFRMQARGYS
ncbi:MAG: ABC transporter ATP-binding protein [Kineosporiaceae bacterium]